MDTLRCATTVDFAGKTINTLSTTLVLSPDRRSTFPATFPYFELLSTDGKSIFRLPRTLLSTGGKTEYFQTFS